MASELDKILVCGSGLAFEMTLAALAHALPDKIDIVALEVPGSHKADPFYGQVSSPTAYGFWEMLGLNEADILRGTNTNFAFGTQYQNWAGKLDWVQGHNLPFPVWNNVPFHHYLARLGQPLEPYLVGANAGLAGRFAHPPSDPKIALSRAEYGYQFSPDSLAGLIKSRSRVRRETGEIAIVKSGVGRIEFVELTDGRQFKAPFFLDATGSAGLLTRSLDNPWDGTRSLSFTERHDSYNGEIGPLRRLTGSLEGWGSEAFLQDKRSLLSVFTPEGTANASDEAVSMTLGHRENGWIGNCVAIGHASAILEPITPAPFMLLQADIQRLMSLIPVSQDMSVEQREFNRLRRDDIAHSEIFNRALFVVEDAPDTTYWKAATTQDIPPKLSRKITQFESRGFLTAFDLELFNEQDWMILHFGMGRRPQRYDVFIDSIADTPIRNRLDQLKQSIDQIVLKIPPNRRYLDKFLQYLEKRYAD